MSERNHVERHGVMRVYIVRHGKADDADLSPRHSHGGDESPDFRRELTPKGVAQARFLGRRLKGRDPKLRLMLSSAFTRAINTARLIKEELGCDLRTEQALAVDHDPSEAIALLQKHSEERSIMIVGHNPQLGELLSVLALGLPPQEMILKTGEMVALEIRIDQPVGSAKIVQRLRLEETENDDTLAAPEKVFDQARTL
jgi:phosphohistidine phosphatase